MSDLSKLKKFLDGSYRESYLDSDVMGGIAYQVQALREKAGLNQTDFGAVIGMPQSVVSRLENTDEHGGVNVATLLQIANKLGIGLQIRFCNFETLLAADVSPHTFQVENIRETISRLSVQPAMSAANISQTSATAPNIAIVFVLNQLTPKGSNPWQTKSIPTPSPMLVFPGSGISNTERFTSTAASPE